MTRILKYTQIYWYLSNLGFVYLRNMLLYFHVGVPILMLLSLKPAFYGFEFILFISRIYLFNASFYSMCASYQLNAMSIMEIRIPHLCDSFLVLPFLSLKPAFYGFEFILFIF